MRALELLETLSGASPPGPRVGIEQEFEIWRGPERIDFRELIHRLSVAGVRLDPGDVNAYRLRSGLALTCDEMEAELASPPIVIRAGFAPETVAAAALARETLAGLLPAGYSLKGYSTHLSVSWPGPPDAGAAERYARTYGPLFGLVIDRKDSLGIYVRPRPGRLELCGEFVEGERLASVAAFAVGTVLAAARGDFPPELALELLPGQERFGFRVRREACGRDLYAGGRRGVAPLAAGGDAPVESLLRGACAAGRTALAHAGCFEEAREIEAIAAGTSPLGVEAGPEPPTAAPGLLHDRGFELARTPALTPILATWDFAVFRANHSAEARFLSVPAHALPVLYEALAGVEELEALDELDGGPLESFAQTALPGVFSSLPDDATQLLPGEIPVDGEMKARGGRAAKQPDRAGKRPGGRIGKVLLPPVVRHVVPEPPPLPLPADPVPSSVRPPEAPTLPPRERPWKAIAVGAVAAIAAVAVLSGVIIDQSGGSDGAMPTPAATSTVGGAAATDTTRPSPAPTETPRPPASPSPTAKPSETPPTVAGAAATSTATQFATETAQPSNTPVATPTVLITPTPTIRPTETPRPTSPPTSTPTPTATPTPSLDPLPTLISIPTPIAKGCTPSPGTAC